MAKVVPTVSTKPIAAPSTKITEEDDMTTALLKLIQRFRTNQPLTEPDEEMAVADSELDEEPFIDPSELDDKRLHARKVYTLAKDAQERTALIPVRPSSCRRVFRYLQKYDVGTVKQISHALQLDKKTIANALSALKLVNLIDANELRK